MMGHAQINRAFLASIDAETQRSILDNIAIHYGITRNKAFEEVTEDGAEHLLDYMVGPERAAASVLMQRHAVVRAPQKPSCKP